MDSERGAHTIINFVLQVHNRLHLARIMRAVRRIPEVVRITRVRTEKAPEKNSNERKN
jgi:guanosine-3',5'-bis(diphosphate) 3'-pyrophosphohydrolase